MNEIVTRCDFLLIDAPAGISKDGIVPLAVADEVILVVNPELSSIVDALKTRILTELVGGHVLGSIINRVNQDNPETMIKKVRRKCSGSRLSGLFPKTRTSSCGFCKDSARHQIPDIPGLKSIPPDCVRPHRCGIQR